MNDGMRNSVHCQEMVRIALKFNMYVRASFKVVVLRDLFDPREFDEDASRILAVSSRLREHCAKFGRVTKVVVYDKHVEGVAQVFFGTPEEADMAISMLDGRIFSNKKVMRAATWDGKEKFKVRIGH